MHPRGILLGCAAAAAFVATAGPTPRAELAEPVAATRFMVAAANPLAAQAGFDVLKAGGNAVDAMVAVQFMLNLVEPQSSGIGGGAFLLYWDAGARRLYSFDGRETAPEAATPDYFLEPDGTPMAFSEARMGGRSVGVPGTLRLLDDVHARFGSRDWAELIAPTIARAREGFAISPRLAASIAKAQQSGLDRFAPARNYFFEPDRTPKAAGTILVNAEFAATLERIAAGRSAPFYEGAIAADILRTVREAPVNPGIMTAEDLRRYTVRARPPVCVDYRGFAVCGMGPPSSGGLTVGQILGILGHVDMPGLGYGVNGIHAFLEASRLAYADRALYMADSDFVPVPTEGLLDPVYLRIRAQLLRLDTAMGEARPGNPPWHEPRRLAPDASEKAPGTSHFVIVDEAGNAVSMTTTIESGFGSRLMVGGFLLNNELTDFSFLPEKNGMGVANRVEGGKRPRSSMAPTVVLENGAPRLLLGSPGGSRIIAYVAETILAILDWRMDPQAAVELPRFVNRNGVSELERGTAAEALAGPLEARGHEVAVRPLSSGLQVILIEPGRLLGGADPRREGVVLGE